jgi:pSer/pThr/pTyr-binding forkhead associated (FHA) protein
MYRAWDLPATEEPAVPATQPVGNSQSQPTPTPQEDEPLARLVSMDSQVASIACTLETMVLGRKQTCSVVLDDPTVSAVHCRIYFDDIVPLGSLRPDLVLQHAEQQQLAKQAAAWPPARSINGNGEVFFGASHFWIEDLSSNGTFVNMVKLGRNCRARLCHNDVISLCKPEQKRKTKGTKMTWQFQLSRPQKLEKVSRQRIKKCLTKEL